MFTYRNILCSVLVLICAFIFYCDCRSSFDKDVDESHKIDDTVQYYEDLIQSELEKALKYELPTNAKMYQPDDDVIRDCGTFDFIIIGAGSTGSVMASRLSEISKWKILLLEAGKYPNNFTMIPGYFAIQAMTEYNWGFVSTPQKTSCLGAKDNRCVIPRGKGIGGTSLINQLIYSRGNPMDYDKWAALLQDHSWRYKNVLRYFKKSEDFHKTNPEAPLDWEYHGKEGNWYTNFHVPPSNFTKLFLQANQEMGKNITDYNGKQQLGATILQMNTKRGQRFDQASAFIKPVKGRKNLIISEESYVIKIEINNKTRKSTGVLFTKNKKTYRAKVNLEVILSAGAVSSPQILMLSGIGPKNHLNQKGIPVIQDLEVGSIIRDHVYCPISFASNTSFRKESFKQNIKEYLQGYGDLTAGNPLDSAGWYKTKLETVPGYPDIEIIPTSESSSEIGRKFSQWDQETWNDILNNKQKNPFTLTVVLLKTKSKGTVRLHNKNPFNYPEIDTNILSDPDRIDIDTILEGIKLAISVTKTKVFQKIGTKLSVPRLKACSDDDYLSEDYWECYMRQMSIPAFHLVGSCPSGSDPKRGAVVDWNMNVYGLKNLRVVDASVMPFTFSGHPNAICTMIAEKVSDVIKFEYEVLHVEM